MLSFAVYEDGQPAREFALQHAHLMGANDVGVQGEIAFADGVIRCEKSAPESAALVLMVDAGEHGRLMLPTCLLPDREEPYLLHLELARHRIKMFLAKLEDWLLFELDGEHPVLREWHEARDLFTEALTHEHADGPRADGIGREALLRAIAVGEKLACMHADMLLAKRQREGSGGGGRGSGAARRQQAPARQAHGLEAHAPEPMFGCRIHQSQFADPLTRIMSDDFDFISIPIRWREVEPEEGEYDWSKFDRWLEWAEKAKYPVMLGPIVDFRTHSAPEWLYVWEHDYDTLYDLLHEHIEAVVKRYKRAVSIWNIASSLHINESFTLAYEQLMDVTRMATGLVKTLHPAGRSLIEVTEPFGEYYAANPKSVPPVVYAEMVAQAGFKLDLVGVNVQMGHHRPGQTTRDLMQLSSVLDMFLFLDMPVIVTGLGCPSHRPKFSGGTDFQSVEGKPAGTAVPPDAGGWYQEPWSPQRQANWLRKAIAVAMGKPFIESVVIHELFDHPGAELPGAGLITGMGRPKPALATMSEVHRELTQGTLRCSRPEERDWVISELPMVADEA